jgi:hypothetical protein
VYQSSKKIKKQFGEMQEKMQNDLRNYKNQQAAPRQEATSTKEGDYIDFEEVKK